MRPLKHPCVTDQLLRRKEIKEAINKLKGSVEIESQKKSEILKATQSLDSEQQLVNLNLIDLDKSLKELDKMAKLKINSSVEILQDEDKLADVYIAFINKLKGTIEEKNKQLIEIQDRAERTHDEIVKETKILVHKRRDIGIYQKRLEKKYKEIYPNRELII